MRCGQQFGPFSACAYSLGRASCMRFVCMCSPSNNNTSYISHVPVINERFHPSIRFQTLVASATDTNTHAIFDTNQHSTLSPSPSLPPNISHPLNRPHLLVNHRIHLLAARVSLSNCSPCARQTLANVGKQTATCHSHPIERRAYELFPRKAHTTPYPQPHPSPVQVDTAEM